MGFFDWFKKHKGGRECFNDYQEWYSSLGVTPTSVDLILTVRVRAFGSEAEKQAAWNNDWRSKHSEWGPAAAGVSVSSDPPEVWLNLKEADGQLVLPPHVLGHELMHALKLQDQRLIEPDKLEDL